MPSHQTGAQSNAAKRAESGRPFHGTHLIDDPELASEFRDRATVILKDLLSLDEQRIDFSPFLEIGAGSVQRSAALINRYPAVGVATDISQNSLRNMPYMLSLLGYDHGPMLVCCDAHHLPFLEDTFRFVFAYRTLHHFSDPVPVVAECHRVLGRDGYFFFNEEPMGSVLKTFLRGNRNLAHPRTRAQRWAQRLGVEMLLWDDTAIESSLGITEARFRIGVWREALRPFGQVSVEVSRRLRLRSDLYRPAWAAALSRIWGGNVRGLCQKTEGSPAGDDLRDRMMCVDCNSAQLSSAGNERMVCAGCGRRYPIVEGIVRMLPKELEARLYDEAEEPSAP